MKITNSLMSWLAKAQMSTQAQTSRNDQVEGAPAVKDEIPGKDAPANRPPGVDKINLSETALQMSQDNKEGLDPQISAEEKEALNDAFQSPTYQPSLANLARRVLNFRLF